MSMTIDERDEEIERLQKRLLDHLDETAGYSGIGLEEVHLRNRIEQLRRAQRLAKEMECNKSWWKR